MKTKSYFRLQNFYTFEWNLSFVFWILLLFRLDLCSCLGSLCEWYLLKWVTFLWRLYRFRWCCCLDSFGLCMWITGIGFEISLCYDYIHLRLFLFRQRIRWIICRRFVIIYLWKSKHFISSFHILVLFNTSFLLLFCF